MGQAAVFAALEKWRSFDSGNKATALQQVVLAETGVSQPLRLNTASTKTEFWVTGWIKSLLKVG